jgi:hypothetical protein
MPIAACEEAYTIGLGLITSWKYLCFLGTLMMPCQGIPHNYSKTINRPRVELSAEWAWAALVKCCSAVYRTIL